MLAAALELLAARTDLRAAMSAAAREYVAREHDLDRVADATRPRSRRPRAAPPSPTRCSGAVAEAAAEVGIETCAELAARARERGLVA